MRKISITSKDGLSINADYYPMEGAGMILLCHRSHFHRGEYTEIAPKLNQLGYACLAIDQRSGMNVLGLNNETKMRAKEQGLTTGYLDAKQDIEAGIDYCFKKNNSRKIIVIGSSYSASLALVIATETEKLKAVIAYSPSECLKKTKVATSIQSISLPIFVSSAAAEIDITSAVVQQVDSNYLRHFKPKKKGFHGARTLWENVDGHEEQWEELKKFLQEL